MSTLRAAIIRATSIAVLLSFGKAGCADVLWLAIKFGGMTALNLQRHFSENRLKLRLPSSVTMIVDKQYAIYICGNQYMHPPMIHLAEPFAKEGEKVVDFLKPRLLEASDDLIVRDIVLVFTWMARQKTYDVAGDSNLMRITEERVSQMKDPDWRRLSEQDLNEIRG
jgi:hypothetical protein